MEDIIKDWLTKIASSQAVQDPNQYQDLDNESFSHFKPYNIDIGEVDVQDIESVEQYSDMLHLRIDFISDTLPLNGSGCFTLKNGDYFKGEFFGNLSNREGTFNRISKTGSTIEGTWKKGRAEVNIAHHGIPLIHIIL